MTHLPIPDHGKFYDLNLLYDNVKNVTKKLTMLVELGYEVIALNTILESTPPSKQNKKSPIPKPPEKVKIAGDIQALLESSGKNLLQLLRITIELKEIDDLVKVRDAINSGWYDIIAVLPRSERLFHSCCTELNVDIICIEGTEKLPYVPRHKLVKCANTRGLYFEVNYSPMIRDTTVRRITISNIQRLFNTNKCHNLIVSSKALLSMELRGPYDVANLCSLFSLPENSFIHTVSKNCRAVLVHGFMRKTAKSAIFVQKIAEDTIIAKNEKPDDNSPQEQKQPENKEVSLTKGNINETSELSAAKTEKIDGNLKNKKRSRQLGKANKSPKNKRKKNT